MKISKQITHLVVLLLTSPDWTIKSPDFFKYTFINKITQIENNRNLCQQTDRNDLVKNHPRVTMLRKS